MFFFLHSSFYQHCSASYYIVILLFLYSLLSDQGRYQAQTWMSSSLSLNKQSYSISLLYSFIAFDFFLFAIILPYVPLPCFVSSVHRCVFHWPLLFSSAYPGLYHIHRYSQVQWRYFYSVLALSSKASFSHLYSLYSFLSVKLEALVLALLWLYFHSLRCV